MDLEKMLEDGTKWVEDAVTENPLDEAGIDALVCLYILKAISIGTPNFYEKMEKIMKSIGMLAEGLRKRT